MERGRKMIAEALENWSKNQDDVCMYCGSKMSIEPAPSMFNDLIVIDVPKHICRQCNDEYESLMLGAAIESFQQERKLKGRISIHDLLKMEEEAASHA